MITDMAGGSDAALALMIQSGGNIVLAGSSGTGANANFVLVEFVL